MAIWFDSKNESRFSLINPTVLRMKTHVPNWNVFDGFLIMSCDDLMMIDLKYENRAHSQLHQRQLKAPKRLYFPYCFRNFCRTHFDWNFYNDNKHTEHNHFWFPPIHVMNNNFPFFAKHCLVMNDFFRLKLFTFDFQWFSLIEMHI